MSTRMVNTNFEFLRNANQIFGNVNTYLPRIIISSQRTIGIGGLCGSIGPQGYYGNTGGIEPVNTENRNNRNNIILQSTRHCLSRQIKCPKQRR